MPAEHEEYLNLIGTAMKIMRLYAKPKQKFCNRRFLFRHHEQTDDAN